jgi:glycosyltransferase involved in cell wall biosynthesis
VSRGVGRGDSVTDESAHGPGSTHGGDVSANERRRNHDLPRAKAALPLEHQHSICTVNSLRVLWLSPWMRHFARVRAEALRRRGVDVLLVTTDNYHPESDAARDYELVLDVRLRRAATWPAYFAAWRRVREYRPDIVIAELVTDPRWIALAGSAPRVQSVHDDTPKDTTEQQLAYLRGYRLAVFDRWGARSTATITHSDYVAAAVATRRDVRGTPIHVVPLTSDLDAALVPPLVGPEGRHDFVMIGRLNQYKNVDVVLEAWQRHVAGGGWRGDDLVFIGWGEAIPGTLPKHTRWRPGKYRYSDVITTLASAKGSITHYRRASQSGAQVLSMQLGVMPIVSTAGGLPEYQPPGCPPVGVDDVAGLAAAFDDLADPVTATLRGAAAAGHYAERFAVDWATDRLLNVLTEVLAARSPAAPTNRGCRDTGTVGIVSTR